MGMFSVDYTPGIGYNRFASVGLGTTQIMNGIFCMFVWGFSLARSASYAYTGSGMWCGLMVRYTHTYSLIFLTNSELHLYWLCQLCSPPYRCLFGFIIYN